MERQPPGNTFKEVTRLALFYLKTLAVGILAYAAFGYGLKNRRLDWRNPGKGIEMGGGIK